MLKTVRISNNFASHYTSSIYWQFQEWLKIPLVIKNHLKRANRIRIVNKTLFDCYVDELYDGERTVVDRYRNIDHECY